MEDRPERMVSFFREGDRALLSTGNGAEYADGSYSLHDLFEGSGSRNDLVRITPDDVTDGFAADPALVKGTETDFQILAANVKGLDFLALRFIGNGDTEYAARGLGYENTAGDDFWVFQRMDYAAEDAAKELTERQYASMRNKGQSFYAFLWCQEDGACWMQEIKAAEYLQEWYDQVLPSLRYRYPDNGHALTAVRYELSKELPDRAKRALQGLEPVAEEQEEKQEKQEICTPVLFRVTTDDAGRITDLERPEYLSYGLYLQPGQRYSETVRVLDADQDMAGITAFDGFTAVEGDPAVRAMFLADVAVRDFKFLSLELQDVTEDGKPKFGVKELYSQKELTPERPLVVTLVFYGDSPSYGISYVDTDGEIRNYALNMSGMDGSLFLLEF